MANALSSWNDDDVNGSLSVANGNAKGGALTNRSSHAGSAFEGRNRTAFDPWDLEGEAEDVKAEGGVPMLTIVEEALPLGLKDKQVRVLHFITLLLLTRTL